MSTTPPLSIHTLAAGDALAAGQTIRALVEQGRVPPFALDIMRRVGEWLVKASNALPVKLPEGTELAPLNVRASDLVVAALGGSNQDHSEAFQALIAALAGVSLRVKHPRHVIAIGIDTLNQLRDQLPTDVQ